ncbi:hypothetical protein LWC34_22565 [Kibdelosporangium philippinense]|uniref:Uncharacterized protein n=1 Tax=Kibdelosporangium philippinense TaxID=211113 RepID=A0ABS8ZDR0_9PSEU|nr:hypothetical protein [Kibdelosporangium philippinense]MCE7005587.1 hypothetical protein [Kibdelosporangium philippinense]
MTENTPAAQQPDDAPRPDLPPLTITPPQNTAQQPVDTEWLPLPGEQFPAAVLPQSPYQEQQTPYQETNPYLSGPLPAVGYPAPVPRKPRNKPAIVMSALAIVFFLAAGALGALWLVEQGDHKGTSGELQTVQANLAKTAKRLEDTESERIKAVSDKQRAEQNAQATKPCTDAAKSVIRSINEEEFRKGFQEMVKQC